MRQRDPIVLAKILKSKQEGTQIQEIAKELGISRQTVHAYLQTPEAKRLTEQLQNDLLGILNKAVEVLQHSMTSKQAQNIVCKLGAQVLSQVPTASQEISRLESADREAIKARLLRNINTKGEDIPPETAIAPIITIEPEAHTPIDTTLKGTIGEGGNQ